MAFQNFMSGFTNSFPNLFKKPVAPGSVPPNPLRSTILNPNARPSSFTPSTIAPRQTASPFQSSGRLPAIPGINFTPYTPFGAKNFSPATNSPPPIGGQANFTSAVTGKGAVATPSGAIVDPISGRLISGPPAIPGGNFSPYRGPNLPSGEPQPLIPGNPRPGPGETPVLPPGETPLPPAFEPPSTPTPPPQASGTAPLSKEEKAVAEAQSAYDESLRLGPDELSTQEDLDKLIEATKKGYSHTSDIVMPLESITGRMASIEGRALDLAEPLQAKLARLQAKRTASLESSKFALERADKALAAKTGKAGEAFTLSPGEIRYDAKGNEIAKGPDKPLDPKAPTTMETAQGIMQWNPATGKWESTGFSKPTSAAAEEKAVEKSEAERAKTTASLDTANLINQLLRGNYQGITGVGRTSVFGLRNQQEQNQFKQIKAQLALGARQLIKGSGAISDFEASTLQNASSALGTNLSNEAFAHQLNQAKGALMSNAGVEVTVKITDPSDGSSDIIRTTR